MPSWRLLGNRSALSSVDAIQGCYVFITFYFIQLVEPGTLHAAHFQDYALDSVPVLVVFVGIPLIIQFNGLHLPLLFPNRLNIFVIPCVVFTEKRMWISSRVDVLDSGFVFDRKVPELISLNMWAGCLSQTITVGIFLMAFVTVRQVSWHRERCNFQSERTIEKAKVEKKADMEAQAVAKAAKRPVKIVAKFITGNTPCGGSAVR